MIKIFKHIGLALLFLGMAKILWWYPAATFFGQHIAIASVITLGAMLFLQKSEPVLVGLLVFGSLWLGFSVYDKEPMQAKSTDHYCQNHQCGSVVLPETVPVTTYGLLQHEKSDKDNELWYINQSFERYHVSALQDSHRKEQE